MRQKSALIFLAIVLAILLPLLLQIAWVFITPFVLASVLAIMLHPAKEWLRARLHRPGVSAFLITLAAVLPAGSPRRFRGFESHAGAYECIQYAEPAFPGGRWLAIPCRTDHGPRGRCRCHASSDRQRSDTDGTPGSNERGQRVFAAQCGRRSRGVTSAVINGLLGTIFLSFPCSDMEATGLLAWRPSLHSIPAQTTGFFEPCAIRSELT